MKTLLRLIATLIVLAETAFLVKLVTEQGPPPVEATLAPVVVEVTPLSFAEHCDKTPPADFDKHVQAAAFEFGIDPRVLATTVYRESDCDAKALGSSGEIGLAQVHPDVWGAELVKAGVIRHTDDLWSPSTNLRASAYILAQLSQAASGDLLSTFRRYNGSGPAAQRYAQEQEQAFTSMWSRDM